MSGTNGKSGADTVSGTNPAPAEPDITLGELGRLIRILGMLGSAADSEVLAAARFAQKWLVEHATSWPALLVPPAAPGVLSVAVGPAQPEATAAALDAAWQDGYAKGLASGAQQGAAGLAAQGAAWQNATWQGAAQRQAAQQAAQSAVRQAAAQSAPTQATQAAPHPVGSWQAIAWELLQRQLMGIPGVLRPKEAQFCQDILARGFHTLTPPQEAWLRDIAGRSAISW